MKDAGKYRSSTGDVQRQGANRDQTRNGVDMGGGAWVVGCCGRPGGPGWCLSNLGFGVLCEG